MFRETLKWIIRLWVAARSSTGKDKKIQRTLIRINSKSTKSRAMNQAWIMRKANLPKQITTSIRLVSQEKPSLRVHKRGPQMTLPGLQMARNHLRTSQPQRSRASNSPIKLYRLIKRSCQTKSVIQRRSLCLRLRYNYRQQTTRYPVALYRRQSAVDHA